MLIVLLIFTLPLHSFHKPLTELKRRIYLACSALATRYYRAAERDLLGRNISASQDAEPHTGDEIPDPSKEFTTIQKLSVFVVSRSALLPISAAALIPLVAAGATHIPGIGAGLLPCPHRNRCSETSHNRYSCFFF